MYLLWQIVHEQFDGVLLEVFLEGARESEHGLARAQLRALHHALLVVDEEVGAAGEDVASLLRVHAWHSLLPEVCHEPLDQLLQVPKQQRGSYYSTTIAKLSFTIVQL